jgi:hypothetical protein
VSGTSRVRGAARLDPVDRDSPLGQPAADLPPGLGLATLPGVHAPLRDHELGEVIPPDRLDQTSEISAGAPQLDQQGVCRDAACRRRGKGQGTILRDATAFRGSCFRVLVNDGRSLSCVYPRVNPHVVLTATGGEKSEKVGHR